MYILALRGNYRARPWRTDLTESPMFHIIVTHHHRHLQPRGGGPQSYFKLILVTNAGTEISAET